MTLSPDEAEAAAQDFLNTNVPLATYLRGLRRCNIDPERISAIGDLLWDRFIINRKPSGERT